MTERDCIGPDPIKWIDRLMYVNRHSAFEQSDKETIHAALLDLLVKLNPVGNRRAKGQP